MTNLSLAFVLISGFVYFIFFSIILFRKNIHLLLLYPKHDIKLSWYNLGYYSVSLSGSTMSSLVDSTIIDDLDTNIIAHDRNLIIMFSS